MQRPRERADEVAGGQEGRGEDGERRGTGEAVEGVIERDGARVEPALGEAGADADEERDVGGGAEGEELPQAGAAVDDHVDRRRQERGGEGGEGGARGCSLGVGGVHRGLLG